MFQLSRNADKSWTREDMVPAENPNDELSKMRRGCGWRSTKEKYSDEQIWTLLKKYDAQKALMSASISKSSAGKFSGPCGEEMLETEGLVAGHAYSVIQAFDVTEGAILGIGGIQYSLLQIRNPWGKFEWKGAWGDKSEMWEKNPGVKHQLNHTAADDGAFWISFEDFKDVYTKLNVCDRTTFRDLSLSVNESEGSLGVCKGCVGGCCHYWCCCAGASTLFFGHEPTLATLDAKESSSCLSFLDPKKSVSPPAQSISAV